MNKSNILVALLLVVTNIVILYCYYNWGRATPQQNNNKIEELKLENEILKSKNIDLLFQIDSLRREIGISDSIIVEINHWYEKNLDDITNQSIADDAYFFSEYLSKIDTGFTNSDYSNSIKENKFNLSRTSKIEIGDSSIRKENRFTTRNKYDTARIISSKGSTNK